MNRKRRRDSLSVLVITIMILLVFFAITVKSISMVVATPIAVPKSHWCSPSRFTYSPTSGYMGDSTSFTFTLYNNVGDALYVQNFYVTYSWSSSTKWDLGSATIPGYSSSKFYQTIVLPSSSGSYTITISVYGKASSDWFSETCNFSPATFTVTAPLTVTVDSDISSGTIPFTVSFTCSPSGGTPPYTFSWTFGDGDTSTLQNPTHTYRVAGTYTVQVVVTDSKGKSITQTMTIAANSSPLIGSGQGTPPWVIYLIVLIIIVITVIILLSRRKRKTHQPPVFPITPQQPIPPYQYPPQQNPPFQQQYPPLQPPNP